MSHQPVEVNSEISRIRAALVNSGQNSFSEAEQKLLSSRLNLRIGTDAASTPGGQAAILTAVATGARCFGRVSVLGTLDQPLLLPVPIAAKTLAEAVAHFGAREADDRTSSRTVLIGPGNEEEKDWSVRAFWNGWVAGTAPGRNTVALGKSDCALAGAAAGALAVGQAFLAEQGDHRAGRSIQQLSLWQPEIGAQAGCSSGPSLNEVYLPTALWLAGLGNLGQANLWALTLLPYPRPADVLLFFQDDQKVGKENWGTSVLVQRGQYGALKTRIAEEWATTRGFDVRRVDRRISEQQTRSDREPGILLAGLDRMPPRRMLGRCGFDYIIDAGLGITAADYRKVRLNVFDATEDPAAHFHGVEDPTAQVVEELMKLPAYQELARTLGDGGCGAAMLAETSVAVPFVSSVVGALAVTQAIRIASGQAHHTAIAGEVGDLRSIRATQGRKPDRIVVPNAGAAS
jgi:hypothetical protein